MAYVSDTRFFDLPARGLVRLGGAVLSFLQTIGETRARCEQIDALNALSDGELARRGLTREGILHHVYRDRLGL